MMKTTFRNSVSESALMGAAEPTDISFIDGMALVDAAALWKKHFQPLGHDVSEETFDAAVDRAADESGKVAFRMADAGTVLEIRVQYLRAVRTELQRLMATVIQQPGSGAL